MSGNIDILLRLPDVAAIDRDKLQDYCNEWLERPIAQRFGISHLIVSSNLMLTVNLDLAKTEFVDDKAFIPICELLGYIIDQHFHDSAKRRELHAEARTIWKRWGQIGRVCGHGRESRSPMAYLQKPGMRCLDGNGPRRS